MNAPALRLAPAAAWLSRLWDRVVMYLPALLMGVLALGAWWLARNTPGAQPAAEQAAPTHEADYFLRGFSVKNFDASGRLRSEVSGAQARHFPDTDTLEIERARIHAFNERGELTVATATRALSNGNGSEVQLLGNAVITREASRPGAPGRGQPRLELRGEFLHAFLDTERVRSHRPVVVIHGADRFEAESLDFDNLDRVLDMRGRVRGQLVPGGSPKAPAP